VIAVDTNILVYAHRADSDWHEAAARAVGTLASTGSSWAIPWPCVHEFLAIVTHPRIFSPPSPAARACDQVDAWMESPGLVLLGEDPDYWSRLRETVLAARISGPAVHDARVAVLCERHGIDELWSADRDFSRFAGITVRNPLLS